MSGRGVDNEGVLTVGVVTQTWFVYTVDPAMGYRGGRS